MGLTNAILKITLKSDLCIGSGFSYGGVIDTDVIYDDYGFPYIPGKRIKGCMRDAADEIGLVSKEDSDRLFGIAGDDKPGSLIIGNAILSGVQEIKSEIDAFNDNSEYFSQANIIDMYSSVRGQTKIGENGIAVDNSLRYTRVVNHYNPISKDGKEVVFEAKISFDERDDKLVENLIKATRNIGLNRNRGLGSVVMEKEEISEGTPKPLKFDKITQKSGNIIRYVIKNEESMIISNESDTESIDYIKGTAMLGTLAREYLNQSDSNANDSFFKRIFLGEGACFSNITPALMRDGKVIASYPVPQYIRKMKKSKKLVNVLSSYSGDEWEYQPNNGNQPKKLKTQFIVEIEGKVNVIESKKEIVYHHRKRGEEQLFYFNTISPGQLFAGEIKVSNVEDTEKILNLLCEAKLKLGKSRSSQYGKCELVDVWVDSDEKEKISAKDIVITFLSDTVFMNNQGNYVVNSEELIELIKDKLKIVSENAECFFETTVLTGYMNIWNLQKEQIPAIKAGSAIVFTGIEENIGIFDRGYIGERNVDGYGQYKIAKLSDYSYKVQCFDLDIKKKSTELNKAKPLYNAIQRKIQLSKAINELGKFSTPISSTGIGRLSLMLKESVASSNETDKQKKDFANRISSIKTVKTREDAKKIFRKVNEIVKNSYPELENAWYEIMSAVLIRCKYEKKNEKGAK